jgi:hypothetical protein
LGSPLMLVFDEDSSHLEQEGDEWIAGTLFASWKSGRRATR